MEEGRADVEQRTNRDARLEMEGWILGREREEEGGDDVFRRILALNVWRDGLRGEHLQVMQMCHVSASPSPDKSPAISLLEQQPSATRSPNSSGSPLRRGLALTTTHLSLTADSCRLTIASVETSCGSLAEAQEQMGKLPAGSVGEERFEWVSFFSFELSSSERGIFPPRKYFLRDDVELDILPSLLCPSLNPLLHRIPPLASSLGQVERVLQLRRQRFEAVLLRRRLLLAVREGHVEDPPEIEESSATTSQKKRAITEYRQQDDSLERRKRSLTIYMREDGTLGESSNNVEGLFHNPQEVKRELERELGILLNRHHNSCGWMVSGELGENDECTGDSDDAMAHKTSDDGNISTKGDSAADPNQNSGDILGTASRPL